MSGEIDRLAAYRQAGVDLDYSNQASQIAATWAQTTWHNRAGDFGEPVAFDAGFSSAKRLVLDELRRRPEVDMVCGMDGTGTKPELYERMRNFRGLGYDLIAMAADDNPIEGGETVLLNNTLIVNRLGHDTMGFIDELFGGLAAAANEAKLVLYTGETAVHGDRLQGPTDFSVDWVADAIGLVHRKRALTGTKVRNGDDLWAFAQTNGFRCNGISAARKAFKTYYGDDWHRQPFGDVTIGHEATSPSTIYSALMRTLTGGYRDERQPVVDIHGAAHISGGSIPEKLGRMLKATGLGAEITDPFEPPPIMRHAQAITEVENTDGSKRPMSDEEMITTWHGGQGYIVAIPEDDAEHLAFEAEAHGITAKRIGYVSDKSGIRILSRGVHTPGKIMEFMPEIKNAL